jgi:hypothetical protein
MGWVVATKITREVLESYLHCKTKAYLKLAGQQGIRSDYEALLAETRQEVRKTAIDKMLARHAESLPTPESVAEPTGVIRRELGSHVPRSSRVADRRDRLHAPVLGSGRSRLSA